MDSPQLWQRPRPADNDLYREVVFRNYGMNDVKENTWAIPFEIAGQPHVASLGIGPI